MATKPSKKEVLEAALERGMVTVVVDATDPDVSVPGKHHKNTALILNLSYRFDADLFFCDQHIQTVLSFDGKSFDVRLPYRAISGYKEKNSPGIAFTADQDPEEVLTEEELDGTPVEEPKPKFGLRLIKGGKS